MAYTKVTVSSYDAFRGATLGNAYNVDGAYGAQCWDFAAIFYYSAFGMEGMPQTGNGYAYGCWALRKDVNTVSGLTQVTKLSDVKRGDLIVLNHGRFSGDETGHIAFADQDYSGSNTLRLLGQNQVNPSATVGHAVTATEINCSAFLGGWRYDKWGGSEPEPPTPTKKKTRKRFPWVLYANKLRARQQR